MSRSVNKVTLIGNLGNDPEVRTTAGGGKVSTFSLATSRQWNSQTGEKQEKTEWHRCVAWNARQGSGMGLADIVEKYCRKGERVYVEGSIEYSQWKDKEGQTRYTTEIRVRELMLLGGRGGDFDSDADSSRSRAPARTAGRAAATENTFDDFPAALEDQDDDLPF
ncbi:MAG TPA: single-stranded DNA-binding protein [Gemmatimonadaceae bacterium]